MTRQDVETKKMAMVMARVVAGCATDEERQMLSQWRAESAENEAAYQRLMAPGYMDKELTRASLTSHQRPLADMQRRIAAMEGSAAAAAAAEPRPRRTLWYVAAAAVVGVLLTLAATRYLSPRERVEQGPLLAQTEEIVPGRVQATLVHADGTTAQLSTDTTQAAINGRAATTQVQQASIITPRGGEFKITLEDGTEVWLNAQSRLTYPERFLGEERRVEVEGEAYFKVAKDEEHPFIVGSGGQEVIVHGTEFNIKAYADEPAMATTLVEGSIALRTTGSSGELMLTPGHQATVQRGQAQATVSTVDTEMAVGWRHGIFPLDGLTLDEAMRMLSRWYDFDYRFTDKRVAQVRLMGSIPRYSTFNDVADIFSRIGGVKLTIKGRTVEISR